MPSRDSVLLPFAVGLGLVGLSACGMVRGHEDAPTISLPAGAALSQDAPQGYAPPPAMRREQMSDDRGAMPAAIPESRPDAPPEALQGDGPRGTSGDVREDVVGYAAMMIEPPEQAWRNVAIGVAHPTLPPGTPVELTALDSGRTIAALVVARDTSGAVVALSPGAAQVLGVDRRAAVRVRTVAASPQDQNALRSGQAASPRLDAPPALLAALRRKIPGERAPTRIVPTRPVPTRATPVRNVPRAVTAPTSTPPRGLRGGFMVQVAAVSSDARARALALQIGGHVVSSGGLYRIQIGPFDALSVAQRARDGAARRGYGDARIFHTE